MLALSGKQLVRFATLSAKPETIIAEGLDDPRHVAVDARDNFLITDRGDSHQVKRFSPMGKQIGTIETLLPLGSLSSGDAAEKSSSNDEYEFLPSAASILEEVVPTSFKVRLFKCFLDAAVSEQVARMVAMKGATENAGDMIKKLSMTYNRARQSQITGEIMEIIGGVEALGG